MTWDIQTYFNQFFKGTKDPSLEAMQYFMDVYQDIEKNMKFIHIAGTNGKGSCVEMLYQVLREQGYRVGKFMSPHLVRYNERICVNDVDITDDEIWELIKELDIHVKKYNETHVHAVTLFEFETIMALVYFYRKQVDFVILETGLGGLYDCTNIISAPLVSIITSIGYDHMDILGNQLSEIAYQKAGIIKENSHTVFFKQEEEVNTVIEKVCQEKNNQLHMLTKENIQQYHYDMEFQYFDYFNLKKVAINLKGKMQVYNASICLETIHILNQLGYTVTEKSIRKGMVSVIHKGRMEQIYKMPLILFDGAHNEPAIRNLQKNIQMYYPYQKKDYETVMKLLLEDTNAKFILTSGNDEEEFVKSEILYEVAKRYRKQGQDIIQQTLEEAISSVIQQNHNMVHFVVGSFYVYGNVIKKIEEINHVRNESC